MLSVSDRDAAKRLKCWTDLFWNGWSYYGAYSLARVVITGKGDLKEVLPQLSPNLLDPIIMGVMLNAAVRVVLALNDVLDARALRAPFVVLLVQRSACGRVGVADAAARPTRETRSALGDEVGRTHTG